DERALDVDHIQPRKLGGSDELDNFQALCWLCNTNKGAGDDTDFRAVRGAMQSVQSGCPFCHVADKRIVGSNVAAVAVHDKYPVTPLHTLIVPRRHIENYFDLSDAESRAVHRLLQVVRDSIMQQDTTVVGFNIGINSGSTAGQTVSHCH